MLRVSGCPGASVGVLHQGEVVHAAGYGHRNVEKQLAADQHTVYYLSSLSKTFTALAIAFLVEQGKLDWSTPISQILPTANHWDTAMREESNIVDFLSHRTGLAPKNNIWNLEFAQPALERETAIAIANYLEKLAPLRSQYKYNNWGYAIAAEVITTLTDESSWGAALKRGIFEPLGMNRTITSQESDLDNRAEPYFAMSDGTPHHLPRPSAEDGKIMQGAVGM